VFLRSSVLVALALAFVACAGEGTSSAGGSAAEPRRDDGRSDARDAEAPASSTLEIDSTVSGIEASLRGLSVVDDQTAWASGSDGSVGVSSDGGKTWRFTRVPGHEQRDFRDVEALSSSHALVVAVGAPGIVLETTDGGASWRERLRDERPEVFLDAVECFAGGGAEAGSSSRCLLLGDPIDGRFLLFASEDGGASWDALEGPEALPGEAAFAASGTALRFAADGEVAIGTGGGAQARVLLSHDFGRSWRAEPVPLAAGAPTRGVFSLAPAAPSASTSRTGSEGSSVEPHPATLPPTDVGWVAVGGDYSAEDQRAGTVARRAADGSRWLSSTAPPGGYRSAVERLADGRLIATGPNGTDVSEDGGATWRPLAGEGFHAVRGADRGGLALLAGADGRLARLVFGE